MRCFLFLSLALCLSLSASDVSPRVGVVEIYGDRHVSKEKIRSTLGIHEGDPPPSSKGQLEEKLDAVSGVIASRVELACCLDGNMILYVGILEKGVNHVEFRPGPDGDISLQSDLTQNYADFLEAVNESVRLNEKGESLNLGYSLMQNPEARAKQQAFIPMVAKYLETIHLVIRTSRNAEHRAMAAYILQYGPRTPRTSKGIVDDLQYALQDVDDTVRANAIRALTAMYVGAKLHPEQGVLVQPTWFVELLNSIVWSDRHSATVALVDMTEKRDVDTLQLIRERALPSLAEMARWRDLTHALPAFILLGRLSGQPEKQIQDAWVSGDHNDFIKHALKSKRPA